MCFAGNWKMMGIAATRTLKHVNCRLPKIPDACCSEQPIVCKESLCLFIQDNNDKYTADEREEYYLFMYVYNTLHLVT